MKHTKYVSVGDRSLIFWGNTRIYYFYLFRPFLLIRHRFKGKGRSRTVLHGVVKR